MSNSKFSYPVFNASGHVPNLFVPINHGVLIALMRWHSLPEVNACDVARTAAQFVDDVDSLAAEFDLMLKCMDSGPTAAKARFSIMAEAVREFTLTWGHELGHSDGASDRHVRNLHILRNDSADSVIKNGLFACITDAIEHFMKPSVIARVTVAHLYNIIPDSIEFGNLNFEVAANDAF